MSRFSWGIGVAVTLSLTTACRGPAGVDGESVTCEATQTETGVTVVCTDGTTFTLADGDPGDPGDPGPVGTGIVRGMAVAFGQSDHTGTTVTLSGGPTDAGTPTVTTDASGAYEIEGPAGVYTLSFERAGFGTRALANVQILPGTWDASEVLLYAGDAVYTGRGASLVGQMGDGRFLVADIPGLGNEDATRLLALDPSTGQTEVVAEEVAVLGLVGTDVLILDGLRSALDPDNPDISAVGTLKLLSLVDGSSTTLADGVLDGDTLTTGDSLVLVRTIGSSGYGLAVVDVPGRSATALGVAGLPAGAWAMGEGAALLFAVADTVTGASDLYGFTPGDADASLLLADHAGEVVPLDGTDKAVTWRLVDGVEELAIVDWQQLEATAPGFETLPLTVDDLIIEDEPGFELLTYLRTDLRVDELGEEIEVPVLVGVDPTLPVDQLAQVDLMEEPSCNYIRYTQVDGEWVRTCLGHLRASSAGSFWVYNDARDFALAYQTGDLVAPQVLMDSPITYFNLSTPGGQILLHSDTEVTWWDPALDTVVRVPSDAYLRSNDASVGIAQADGEGTFDVVALNVATGSVTEVATAVAPDGWGVDGTGMLGSIFAASGAELAVYRSSDDHVASVPGYRPGGAISLLDDGAALLYASVDGNDDVGWSVWDVTTDTLRVELTQAATASPDEVATAVAAQTGGNVWFEETTVDGHQLYLYDAANDAVRTLWSGPEDPTVVDSRTLGVMWYWEGDRDLSGVLFEVELDGVPTLFVGFADGRVHQVREGRDDRVWMMTDRLAFLNDGDVDDAWSHLVAFVGTDAATADDVVWTDWSLNDGAELELVDAYQGYAANGDETMLIFHRDTVDDDFTVHTWEGGAAAPVLRSDEVHAFTAPDFSYRFWDYPGYWEDDLCFWHGGSMVSYASRNESAWISELSCFVGDQWVDLADNAYVNTIEDELFAYLGYTSGMLYLDDFDGASGTLEYLPFEGTTPVVLGEGIGDFTPSLQTFRGPVEVVYAQSTDPRWDEAQVVLDLSGDDASLAVQRWDVPADSTLVEVGEQASAYEVLLGGDVRAIHQLTLAPRTTP
ncbi:MAG: carboxypeptidase-like regulatory domain-containing protein [Myxococcales bacterium]|nr:carboxypeptidase-like regulatory domain-containing protein [Myxococcales bacterium]